MSSPSSSPPAGLGPGVLMAVMTATLFWGGSFPIAKYALVQLSPMALAGLRFAIAAGLYSAVLVVMRGRYPRIAWRDWPVIFGLGMLGVTLHFWMQYTGVDMTTASNAALLIATAPIWVAVFARAMYRERITRASWLGIFVSYLGVAMIVRASSSSGVSSGHIQGDLIMVLDAGIWALFTVLGRGITRRYPPFQITAWIGVFGALGLLPLGLAAGVLDAAPSLDAGTWMAVLFLAGPCTLVGYGGWYYALSRVDASRIAPYQYLQPLYAVVLAAILLGEAPGWSVVLGGALILGGLYITGKGKTPPRRGRDIDGD